MCVYYLGPDVQCFLLWVSEKFEKPLASLCSCFQPTLSPFLLPGFRHIDRSAWHSWTTLPAYSPSVRMLLCILALPPLTHPHLGIGVSCYLSKIKVDATSSTACTDLRVLLTRPLHSHFCEHTCRCCCLSPPIFFFFSPGESRETKRTHLKKYSAGAIPVA